MTKIPVYLYGLYVWVVFSSLGLPSTLLMILLPGDALLPFRRKFSYYTMRAVMLLIGIRLEVRGHENLPDQGCIAVANHRSLLDGPMTMCALPHRFSFVVKHEARKTPVYGIYMHRMNVQFVRRFAPREGSNDARRLMRWINSGNSLCFFPEGHVSPDGDLKEFRLGAFVIASRTGVPVVPVCIRGSREVLTRGNAIPRPGKISIDILPAVDPSGYDRRAAQSLRDAAHESIQDTFNSDTVSNTVEQTA